MQAARYTIPNPKMELWGLYGLASLVRARVGGLSAARTRGGCGRGQVAYRRLGHVTTLLESSVTRPYDAAIVYTHWQK